MIIINNNFDLGEIVYIKTDPEQLPRIITAIMQRVDGGMSYQLSQGEIYSFQYEVELSREQNMELKTSLL
jgi:hypothetical protein